MYIWNVNDGALVGVEFMSNLYEESNTNIFGLYSYITGGFDIEDTSDQSGIKISVQPGAAVALENDISNWGGSGLLSNLTSIVPIARITDTFNSTSIGQSITVNIPANTSGYLFLNINLVSGLPYQNTYTTKNTIMFMTSLPVDNPPVPTEDNDFLIGQILLYTISSDSSSVINISDLGPTRQVVISGKPQIIDQFLGNYYSPLNYLLTSEEVSQGNGFEDGGVYLYPTNYLPKYSSILLGNGNGITPGKVYKHNMKYVGRGNGNLSNLAFVQITPELQIQYPQFVSTGIYIVKSGSSINSSGIFIADSIQYQLEIPNPFTNPVTTPGCYFIVSYISDVSGILIGNSKATVGYHSLLLGYDGNLYDIIL